MRRQEPSRTSGFSSEHTSSQSLNWVLSRLSSSPSSFDRPGRRATVSERIAERRQTSDSFEIIRSRQSKGSKSGRTPRILAARIIPLVLLLVLIGGCAEIPRTEFTNADQNAAMVTGYSGIRTWGDATLAEIEASGIRPPRQAVRKGGEVDYLALSGGGSGGAFGAGLLTGWTKTGKRPSFNIVSGVSTGALIAPFAFLGPRYDPVIEALYTSGIASDISTQKNLFGILTSPGLVDTGPFQNLIATYANANVLRAVAAEHRKGRRLYVVTTNLDAQRSVLWDMGAIAASGNPGSLELFQKVLQASASIPAVFPPVLIDVNAGPTRFSEMHADGGVTTQVFTLPDAFLASSAKVGIPKGVKADLYVVINNAAMPEFEVVKNSTIGVASRAYSTLIKSHLRGSLFATQAAARRSDIDLYVAAIDKSVTYDPADPFNADYMRTLYELGRRRAATGRLWNLSPLLESTPGRSPPRPSPRRQTPRRHGPSVAAVALGPS